LRYQRRDQYKLKLLQPWGCVAERATLRQALAQCTFQAILDRIPPEAPARADLLVEFAAEDILQALNKDMTLPQQSEPLAAIDSALLFLHENRVIHLQQGLAVFRQALTVRLKPSKRRYEKRDFMLLAEHYRERLFQIHVMNEYARRGVAKIHQALTLASAYFSLPKKDFVARYFKESREILARATSPQGYRRIVEVLNNSSQTAIVTAPAEANLLVLAGPGAGKTRTVIHRCAYLLRVAQQRPESILIVCFNRNAAIELRQRLLALVGAAARGVTVQTYHGLALRLCGRSLALSRAEGDKPVDFDGLVETATQRLKGVEDMPGFEPDELRERLLAGYRTILVDEYQDIDARQYGLISAIAGRTLQERDDKLAILAVGDDDQNIYQFRGAHVEFIRRFQTDYPAKIHYLLENYRSSVHIINAANQLIQHNQDRMKAEQPIGVDQARRDLPPGGRWERLDPTLGQGRVQVLQVDSLSQQAQVLVSELLRLKALDNTVPWSDFAVLVRTWRVLEPIRAALEYAGIPVDLARDRRAWRFLFRVREVANFLDELRNLGNSLCKATDLYHLVPQADTPWRQYLQTVLTAWRHETADQTVSAKQTLAFIVETLQEQQRDGRVGKGVFLGTVHGAKGMEFCHVFVPEGGWKKALRGQQGDQREAERRLYYVAMTRARETLCLFEQQTNPHTTLLTGASIRRRRGSINVTIPSAVLSRRYHMLGLDALYLSYPSRFPKDDPLHRRLADLTAGSELTAQYQGNRLWLLNKQGARVACLAKSARAIWRERLQAAESIKVLAMVRRYAIDNESAFRQRCRCEVWEIPICEVIHKNI
jgi:ATP-dependent DNA helicase RecQ